MKIQCSQRTENPATPPPLPPPLLTYLLLQGYENFPQLHDSQSNISEAHLLTHCNKNQFTLPLHQTAVHITAKTKNVTHPADNRIHKLKKINTKYASQLC